jgi:hypothetical protein
MPPASHAPPVLAIGYLWLQAAAVTAWWLVLWLVPAARAPFLPAADWPDTALLAFALPDLIVLVAGSAAAAHGLRRARPWALPCLWCVAGAVAYATLWCLGANAVTGGGVLSTALMLASCAGMAFVLRSSR